VTFLSKFSVSTLRSHHCLLIIEFTSLKQLWVQVARSNRSSSWSWLSTDHHSWWSQAVTQRPLPCKSNTGYTFTPSDTGLPLGGRQNEVTEKFQNI